MVSIEFIEFLVIESWLRSLAKECGTNLWLGEQWILNTKTNTYYVNDSNSLSKFSENSYIKKQWEFCLENIIVFRISL